MDLSVVYGLLGWLGAAVIHIGPHAPHRLNILIAQNSKSAMYVYVYTGLKDPCLDA